MSLVMKRYFFTLCIWVLSVCFGENISAKAATDRTQFGIYTWCSWSGKTHKKDFPFVKGVSLVPHWDSVEPTPGNYDWSNIDAKMKKAADEGFNIFMVMWFNPCCPSWLFDNGVPRIAEKDSKGKKRVIPWPLDEDYQKYYHRMIREFGRHLRSLDTDIRERIVCVQTAEGSTGDEGLFKGAVPTNKRYRELMRNDPEWIEFRKKAWLVYDEAFQQGDRPKIPIMIHPGGGYAEFITEMNDWIFEHMELKWIKRGNAGHGYHVPQATGRMGYWTPVLFGENPSSKPIYSRCELDSLWMQPWFQKDLDRNLYWSILFGLQYGLDMWNVREDAIAAAKTYKHFEFFNKYAGQKDPRDSPGAFSALRHGLDVSDTVTFPEDKFGKAFSKNSERYKAIVKVHAKNGAVIEDDGFLFDTGIRHRQRKGYVDVGWQYWRGNYERFLTQIDPDATSTGWWHVGPSDSIYGRFARSIHAGGEMLFRLDKSFFSDDPGKKNIRVTVTYLDKGYGQWSLNYFDGADRKQATKARLDNSGKWKHEILEIDGAVFTGGLDRGADLTIKHLSGGQIVFHMIELDRH